MTEKTKIIIISVVSAILVLGAFTGGFFASRAYYGNKKPIIKIVKETVTTTKIIKVPMNDAEWEAWKLAPMQITGTMRGSDVLYVEASDGFKMGSKSFTLKTTCPDEGKNILSFNYVGIWGFGHSDMSYSHGGMIQYTRMLIPMIGINFGVLATQRELGVTAGISVKF